MKTRRFVNYMGGLLCALPLLSACDNDDWKDEVDALKDPVPQGIVWLMDDVTTVNGGEFEIRFRVNPSGATLTAENFQLDVADETVYRLQTEETAAQTKASYVTTPAHYQLLSVTPDVNGWPAIRMLPETRSWCRPTYWMWRCCRVPRTG